MSEAINLMPGPVETADASPGRRLAEARQALSLTPADIARQLKLSVWQVEALEAGRYHQLPGPIFVRGFIRNYARLVKLDGGELLRAGGDSLPQPAAGRETPPSRDIPFPAAETPRWPFYAVALAALVGGLAVYEFYWNEPETGITRPAAVKPQPAPLSREATSVPAQGRSAAASEAGRDEESRASVAAVAAQAPEAEALLAGPQRETERLPRPGERQVRLEFGEESWVEIRDRNERVIFSQLNRPGTQQLVQGLPPFSIVVGNAHRVRLTYDDHPVDLVPHTRIDVARLILQ